MYILFMFIGFVVLICGANIFIEGNVKIAQKLKIPTLIISLTLVSLGTTSPELVVSSIAAIKGSDISLSNVLGSTVANIALVLGLNATLFIIHIEKKLIKQTAKMLGAEIILIVLLLIGFKLSRMDGIILLTLLIAFIINMIKSSKNNSVDENISEPSRVFSFMNRFIKHELVISTIFVLIGVIGLIAGGRIVVDTATTLAKAWGVSEAIIGATIVAVGTSLPELVTSIIAGLKKHKDIVIGNILGSNILNVLFIMGVSSSINNIIFTRPLLIQAIAMILFGFILFILSIRGKISRFSGIALLLSYIAYIMYI